MMPTLDSVNRIATSLRSISNSTFELRLPSLTIEPGFC